MKDNDSQQNRINNLGASPLNNRLLKLCELLKEISFALLESTAAARAHTAIQTALQLDSLNWNVMSDVCVLMVDIDACNIFPTSRENPLHPNTIRQAKELAKDILADVPIGYAIDDEKEKSSTPQEVVFTGKIDHLRRILTRRYEVMAKIIVITNSIDVEIVAFPRTFATYKDELEQADTGIEKIFVCDYDGVIYNLKEIKDVTIPVPDRVEELVEEFFSTYDDKNSQHVFKNQCSSCEGFGRLPNHHNGASYACPDCNGKGFYPLKDNDKYEFYPGQRVRLTITLLDHTTDVHPVNLYKGDLGTVVKVKDDLGFRSDRWGDITTLRRKIDGETRLVLDFCEPVETLDAPFQEQEKDGE